MSKKKKILTVLTFILLILGVSAFFIFKNGNLSKEGKLDLLLESLKGVIGKELNLAPEKVVWNIKEKNLTFSGKGYLYLDGLNALKVSEIYDNLSKFLNNSGFKNDSDNMDISENGSILKKYKKDEIICNLIRQDNPNDTSSVIIACADINDIMYSFASGQGNDCKIDSECGVITDACEYKRVCRNLSYEFYNDCSNPSQLVKDIDFSIAKCQCISNQCAPKQSESLLSPSPLPLK